MIQRGKILTMCCALLATAFVGCSGSNSNNDNGNGGSPNDTTRAQVENIHNRIFRNLGNLGYQNQGYATMVNGPRASGGGALGGTTTGGDSAVTSPTGGGGNGYIAGANLTMIGAFLRNMAAVPPGTRAARVKSARITRQEGGIRDDGSSDGGTSEIGGGDVDTMLIIPPREFPYEYDYYDYYLGLFVHVREELGKSRYSLFEDEAKTLPAGSITSDMPTDWNAYPMVFRSSYEFLKGYLAGSRGSSISTTLADGSYRSEYENIYADGSKDSGNSVFTPRGDSSWRSRTDFADGQFEEVTGAFRSNGSGGTRRSGSDGFVAEYTYNADGSGRGSISGPYPGLPVTIVWDAYGNTTIRFADGTTERIPGWGLRGGDGFGGTTGSVGGGTGSIASM